MRDYIINHFGTLHSGVLNALSIFVVCSNLQCQLISNNINGSFSDENSPSEPLPNGSFILGGVPSGVNSITNLNVTVTSSQFIRYKYKLGHSATINCHLDSNYSLPIEISQSITDDLSIYADHNMTLCLLGQINTSQWQEYSNANAYSWGKDTGQLKEVSLAKTSQTLAESQTTNSFTVILSAPKITETVINYTVAGSAVFGIDHNLADGTVTIPIGELSHTVYYELYDNSSDDINKTLFIGIVRTTGNNVFIGTKKVQHNLIADDEGVAMPVMDSIDLGYSHTCSIDTITEFLYCWGDNKSGQLGDGSNTDSLSPIVVDPGISYSQVSLGAFFTCGLVSSSGELKCWGQNSRGQLGNGSLIDSSSPVTIDPGVSYSLIAAGYFFACGIVSSSNELKCWGSNSEGELGNGSLIDVSSPVPIDPGISYSSIYLGLRHACAIVLDTGILKCWGSNDYGQVGNNSLIDVAFPTPIDSGTMYTSISLGSNHSCGILIGTNELKCWGRNYAGGVGNGSLLAVLVPTIIDANIPYSGISLGGNHTCGVLSNNDELKCWGYNFNGQLGDGSSTLSLLPKIIEAGTDYLRVSLGHSHSCGISKEDLTLKCWGYNHDGQLGDGSSRITTLPKAIELATTYQSLSLGEAHSCGITEANKEVKCWGSNSGGQLGIGSKVNSSVPLVVDAGTSYSVIALGDYHSCGIVANSNELRCWGSNSKGQLGDGSTVAALLPIVIDPGTSYSSVVAGKNHTCGLSDTNELKCWGDNSRGQLGDGSNVDSLLPKIITAGTSYTQISINDYVSCGIVSASNEVSCWGNYSNMPTPKDIGTAYAVISLGVNYTCGLVMGTNVLKCWGFNTFGQIGDGTTNQATNPIVIDGAAAYSELSLGGAHTCAIAASSGALKCWGFNSTGQVGEGSTTNVLNSTIIDSGTSYSSIALGYSHSCGILAATKKIKCWGENIFGQIGDLNKNDFPKIVNWP